MEIPRLAWNPALRLARADFNPQTRGNTRRMALSVRRVCAAMKQRARILIACFVLGVLYFSRFFVFAHAVASDKLSRVTAGMTEAEVESILGAPQHVRRQGGGGTAFCYGGFQQLRWCSVEIGFGADGRVEGSVFHDH